MVNLERVGVNLTVEQKHVLLTVLGIGVSFGVGLGVNKWRNHDMAVQIKDVLHELIVDGKHVKDTFKEFPHYLSERTRWLLTSAACFHLKPVDVSKHTRNLSPASRSILLSGPGEFYHQRLAKALSREFKTKLLVLDMDNFSAKLQNKNGTSTKDSFAKRSFNKGLEHMSRVLLPFSTTKGYVGASLNYPFDEKVFFQELHKVLVSLSETNGIILYIKDIERFLQSPRTYRLFENMLKRLTGSTLVIGSRMSESGNTKDAARLELSTEDELFEKWLKSVMGIPLVPESQESVKVNAKISRLFPYNIEINPPTDKSYLKDWDTQVEDQKKNNLSQDNKKHIAEVLKANDLECNDLGSVCQADTTLISNDIQEIVVYAISHHLMSHKDLVYRNGKLVISSTSLLHGLSIFKEDKLKTKADSSKEVPDNEFEKRIRPEVIPPNEIGVTFEDIGALDETKESLQELVMLPLKRPDLFNGGLLKPCRGILLFGPPGTGKTMLAKAIANEAGASFINVSMSTITSKWIGESEKTVRALFTLAAKVSPTIMFVDEVDSMLGQRSQEGEHEVMRALKNEFMSHWDGLLTKPGERILVLAATNRPFDLDEAIIRRFERRILVGLPSSENREKILKTLLAKENVKDLDFKELAAMTEGYTGSDLKNLCVTASYRPVRELMQQEKQKAIKDKKGSEAHSGKKEKSSSVIKLRHLNMEDMRQAANKVAASFAGGGSVMGELKQWNELYGEGGSRKKEQLSYFL